MSESESQNTDMSAKPAGTLTQSELKKIIEESLFNQPPPGNNITIWTGYKGVMEYARTWLKTIAEETGTEFKEPSEERLHNEIRSQIAAGWIKYDGNGGFQIS